jgi:phosphosulfolactate phosphohydrolase-like enzyme
LKKSAKAVGRRALKAGAQVAQHVADGENVVVSAKTRGKQAVNDFMTGRGRKKPVKRAAPKKTAIRTPAKKRKTSLDSYKPNWHGS